MNGHYEVLSFDHTYEEEYKYFLETKLFICAPRFIFFFSFFHQTVELLGSDFFDVVLPSEFVRRLSENVFHDCDKAQPATGAYTASCQGGQDHCGVLTGVSCATVQGKRITNSFFDHTVCKNSDGE